MIRFALLLAYALITTVAACADNTSSETGLSGWREVVITSHNPDQWTEVLTNTLGWEVRAQGPIDPALRQFWNLPETATGTETLLANIGADRGMIRLVKLDGVEQTFMRADDRPWDTGGHFDFNVRVTGLYSVREKLLLAGWQGDSAPIQYTFGPFEVIEWIARGPDGVRLAFIERLKPTLEGWPHLKIMSRTFNATQSVADMAKASHFFENILGMKRYLEHKGASKEPGPNVLGLPHEAAAQIDREVLILHPEGVNEGSVELLAFDGATGTDLSANMQPYNFGIATLRFPVLNLDKTLASLRARGLELDESPVAVQLAGIGHVKIVGISSPEGARLELYEVITD